MSDKGSADRSVSVVVPCRNRATHVDLLLESLSWSRLPRDRFEVIVCDDGGSDRTPAVVAAWRRRGIHARYHRVRPPALPRNSAVARNLGLRLSRYPIVLNTDSDSVFVDDVLIAFVREMTSGVFCSCGSYFALTSQASADLDAIRRERALTPDDYARLVAGRPDHVGSPDGVQALHGAFGCWRDVLVEVGGYDEGFTEWGWEDRDLLGRLENGLGLRRCFVRHASVVHVWHPPQRGDDGRADLARSGEVSARALQGQMQRFHAEETDSPSWRDVALWSLDIDSGDVTFRPSGYRDSMLSSGEGLLPVARQIFRAQVAEAEAMRLGGFPALAKRFLSFTATLAWERSPRPARWQDAVTRPYVDASMSVPESYAVSDLWEALAECEFDLGNGDGAAHALATLSSLRGGRVRAAIIRARHLIEAGDLCRLTQARGALTSMSDASSPSARALMIELAILDDADDDAFATTVATLSERTHRLDEFNVLLFHGYLDLLCRRSPARCLVPGRLVAAHARWSTNASEHLFSVAVRASRAGLYRAAILLLGRFLSGGAPADERLFIEGRAHLARLSERVIAMGARAA